MSFWGGTIISRCDYIFGIKSYYNITRGNIKQRAFVKIKFKMMDVAPGNLLHCLSSNIHN